MTARHVPKTDRHRQLTRLPDRPKPPDAVRWAPHADRTYVILNDYFRKRADVLVGGRGYLCYDASDLSRAPRPGCLVAFGLAVPPADIVEAKAQRDAEAAARQAAEERVRQLESELRRLQSGS